MSNINVGDKFVMLSNGENIIVNKIIDNGVFECKLSNGNTFVATNTFFNECNKVAAENSVKKVHKKRLNSIPLRDVCIHVLKINNRGMTATEIYKYIKDNNMFVFSEKAKTPANTIHARLREYIKKNNDANITWEDKGKFIFHNSN